MTALRFHTLDVFTDRPFGGNPLAVVLGGDGLSGAQMQRIAREFNLSETVFLLEATRSDAMSRVRIFTPFEELPFAGHPIVGTACLLALIGLVPPGSVVDFGLEAGIGCVPLHVDHREEIPYAELTTAVMPSFVGEPPASAYLADLLGLQPEDLAFGSEAPRVASCGMPVLLAPLRAPELLAGIEVDHARLPSMLKAAGARNLYIYARGYEGELKARMFMPGIGEDPATGAAAAALAGRLASESAQADGRLRWTIQQGVEMGRPSDIRASADKVGGAVTAVRVGGRAVRVMEGVLHAS